MESNSPISLYCVVVVASLRVCEFASLFACLLAGSFVRSFVRSFVVVVVEWLYHSTKTIIIVRGAERLT